MIAPLSHSHSMSAQRLTTTQVHSARCRPLRDLSHSRHHLSIVAAATTFDRTAAKSDRSPRSENVAGDFFVDHTCIDCDTCRWMAPEVFQRVGGQTAVTAQPTKPEGRVQAIKALLSCPTYSIHVRHRTSEELQAAQQGLPQLVLPNIYFCGWNSVKSYAANAYLLVRPGGNVLIDSPKYNPILAKQIEKLGGVQYMVLSHRDDVADHALWAKHFNCPRIIHAGEVNVDTGACEVKVQGSGPWSLPPPGSHHSAQNNTVSGGNGSSSSSSEEAAEDVQLIYTPGHTQHHIALYHVPSKTLFSGDHLAAGDDPSKDLEIFDDFNWYSVPLQLQSVQKLLNYEFLHVLPGHGRMAHFKDSTAALAAVSNLLKRHGMPAIAAHNN